MDRRFSTVVIFPGERTQTNRNSVVTVSKFSLAVGFCRFFGKNLGFGFSMKAL